MRDTHHVDWKPCYNSCVPDPKRVLWYLRKVPLLADLGPDAIARMAERVELREARRRDVVYLPGGYPELRAAKLASNERWRASIASHYARIFLTLHVFAR